MWHVNTLQAYKRFYNENPFYAFEDIILLITPGLDRFRLGLRHWWIISWKFNLRAIVPKLQRSLTFAYFFHILVPFLRLIFHLFRATSQLVWLWLDHTKRVQTSCNRRSWPYWQHVSSRLDLMASDVSRVICCDNNVQVQTGKVRATVNATGQR